VPWGPNVPRLVCPYIRSYILLVETLVGRAFVQWLIIAELGDEWQVWWLRIESPLKEYIES
jgi:hypothetical protein